MGVKLGKDCAVDKHSKACTDSSEDSNDECNLDSILEASTATSPFLADMDVSWDMPPLTPVSKPKMHDRSIPVNPVPVP